MILLKVGGGGGFQFLPNLTSKQMGSVWQNRGPVLKTSDKEKKGVRSDDLHPLDPHLSCERGVEDGEESFLQGRIH